MKETFEIWEPTPKVLARVEHANAILREYAADGYDLTLRQLFYQFVSRDLMPNTQRAYKRLGDTVGKARMAGMTDWDHLVDRVRSTVFPAHWDSPADIVEAAAQSFRINKWEDQPCHVEVMVEKDALSGVLEPVCRELDVRFTANRGYSSLSHFYEIGKRIERATYAGKIVYVLYLGDHDPSGLDMDRDIDERLSTFSNSDVIVKRLALTMPQVNDLNPPPNPAKLTDSRASDYIARYGRQSWELDAVEPRTLAALVRDDVAALRDDDLWDDAIERENEMRQTLRDWADSYDE